MSVQNLEVRFAGVSQVTGTLGPNDPEVGSVIRQGNEWYMHVYNAGSSQVSTGRACVLSGVSGYSVTVSSVTMLDYPVGVVKHATLTTGTYGFVLIRGFTQVQMGADDSCTTGGILGLGVDGALVLKTINTGFICPAFAKAMTGAASGTSAFAFVNIF